MKVSYRVDTFKDFNGDLRHFVIAAVSLPTTALVEEFDNDDEYAFEADYTEDCSKVLLLGFSACQSSDIFDEEIGKKIALGKALKERKYALYATNKGLINSGMVEALLDQEVKFFKKDPGYYLKSYREAQKRHQDQLNLKMYEESLEGDEIAAYNFLRYGETSDVNKMFEMLCTKKV